MARPDTVTTGGIGEAKDGTSQLLTVSSSPAAKQANKPGAPCPECGRSLTVVKTRRKGPWRIGYLACDSRYGRPGCGWKPPRGTHIRTAADGKVLPTSAPHYSGRTIDPSRPCDTTGQLQQAVTSHDIVAVNPHMFCVTVKDGQARRMDGTPVTTVGVEAIATLCQVTPETVRRWARSGRIPAALFIDGQQRWPVQIAELLQRNKRTFA